MTQLSLFNLANPTESSTHTHTSISYKRVHCLFEQSGTFKNEFRKLGYEAYDYDIEDEFGETDYQLDLFNEIDKAYKGEQSIFDNISEDDLVLAFFPCIRFEAQILLWFRGECASQKKWTLDQKLKYSLNLHNDLNRMYVHITKLVIIANDRKLKLMIENPYTEQHYLMKYWCIKPKIIDRDRSKMGDIWVKPTAYWCINFEPYNHELELPDYNKKLKYNYNIGGGIERSLIDSEYAENFIKKYLIGDNI